MNEAEVAKAMVRLAWRMVCIDDIESAGDSAVEERKWQRHDIEVLAMETGRDERGIRHDVWDMAVDLMCDVAEAGADDSIGIRAGQEGRAHEATRRMVRALAAERVPDAAEVRGEAHESAARAGAGDGEPGRHRHRA